MSESPPSTGFDPGDGPVEEPDGTLEVLSRRDFDRRPGREAARRRDARGRRPEVDLYKSRGLDLTPEEAVARRHNRRWMVGLTIVSLVLLGSALIASAIAESNEPSGPKQSAPAGYQTENDGYFSYLVPKSWSNNPEFTDSAGDVETSGRSGWVGEHIAYRSGPPTLGEPRPTSLEAFGIGYPKPYDLSSGHPISIPGAATSYEYAVSRPDGFHAVAIDSWDARTGVELWLMVQAPPAVISELTSSLRA